MVGGRGNSCVGGRLIWVGGGEDGGIWGEDGEGRGGEVGGGHRSPREPAIRVGSLCKMNNKRKGI